MSLVNLSDELLGMNNPNNKYTRLQKLTAATKFFETGSMVKAAKASGVKGATVRNWKYESKWWPIVMQSLKMECREKHSAEFNKIIALGNKQLIDRLVNGDVILETEYERDPETGRMHKVKVERRVPIRAKELMSIVAMAQDKMIMIENLEEELKNKGEIKDGVTKLLDTLITQFRKMQDAKIVHGTAERVTENTLIREALEDGTNAIKERQVQKDDQ